MLPRALRSRTRPGVGRIRILSKAVRQFDCEFLSERLAYPHKTRWTQVYAYLGGVLKGLDTVRIKVGGVSDHVHLLVGLKGGHSVAGVVREVKKSSNGWVREQTGFSEFNWQEGYAGFSVSSERQ